MKQKIYAVRDIKADMFGQPMFLTNKGAAIRSFADAVNDSGDKNNMLNKHPEDFELYEIGEWDTNTGIITGEQPRQVVTASELKQPN